MSARLYVAALILAPAGAIAGEPLTGLSAATIEPRAFGYQLGDVVSRQVSVDVPDGLVLDETSVPRPGARGKALELRSIERSERAERGGRRIELTLRYQVFQSPPLPRTFEMPVVTLRFQGRPRDQDLRIDAWPVSVSPLVPEEVSPRRGLGELQPDAPPPAIDTAAGRVRLIGYGVASLPLIAYLGFVYLGLPWWSRAHRPFTRAWRSLRREPSAGLDDPRRAAMQCLHEALNQTAGEVVFEHGVDRFVAEHARFEALRGDLVEFFRLSRREFFGAPEPGDTGLRWLVDFCRRCRDAERGAA